MPAAWANQQLFFMLIQLPLSSFQGYLKRTKICRTWTCLLLHTLAVSVCVRGCRLGVISPTRNKEKRIVGGVGRDYYKCNDDYDDNQKENLTTLSDRRLDIIAHFIQLVKGGECKRISGHVVMVGWQWYHADLPTRFRTALTARVDRATAGPPVVVLFPLGSLAVPVSTVNLASCLIFLFLLLPVAVSTPMATPWSCDIWSSVHYSTLCFIEIQRFFQIDTRDLNTLNVCLRNWIRTRRSIVLCRVLTVGNHWKWVVYSKYIQPAAGRMRVRGSVDFMKCQ